MPIKEGMPPVSSRQSLFLCLALTCVGVGASFAGSENAEDGGAKAKETAAPVTKAKEAAAPVAKAKETAVPVAKAKEVDLKRASVTVVQAPVEGMTVAESKEVADVLRGERWYDSLGRRVGLSWRVERMVAEVVPMRLAADVPYPRRPPLLPRIVMEQGGRSGSAGTDGGSGGAGGGGSETLTSTAVEFFREPARRVGGDSGMENVTDTVFRSAQPPPAQSRANFRQE